MLTFFPAPYPNEWWYSVLCRYHVRSGYRNYATTSHELYGKKPITHGRLFPGSSIHAVVSQHRLTLDEMQLLTEHTLAPYYMSFFSAKNKLDTIDKLLRVSTCMAWTGNKDCGTAPSVMIKIWSTMENHTGTENIRFR